MAETVPSAESIIAQMESVRKDVALYDVQLKADMTKLLAPVVDGLTAIIDRANGMEEFRPQSANQAINLRQQISQVLVMMNPPPMPAPLV